MSPRRFRWLVAVIAVVAVTFGHLLGPFDFLTFLSAGQQVLHGRSPYPSVTSAVFRSGHGFVYPLFVAWLFAPLAMFPRHIAEAVYACSSVAAIVVSCRLLGRRDVAAPALVLVCSTTIISLQMGTVNAFLLLGLAGAWYWRSSRPLLSGIALGMAAGAKLFLLPVLLWPLLRKRYSSTVAAATTVAVLVGGGALAGVQSPTDYLHLLSQLSADEQVSSWSLSSLFEAVGFSRTGSSAATITIAAAFLIILWHRRNRLADGRVLGALVILSLLASPIVWSSYLLLLAVPLLLSGLPDPALAGAALASWLLVTPDAASTARIAIGVALAAVVAFSVARRHVGTLRYSVRERLPSLALPLAAAGCGLLLVLLVVPAPVRSPLPALAAMGLIVARCLRTSNAPAASAPSPTVRGCPS